MAPALTALIAATIGGILYYFTKAPRFVSLLAIVTGLGINGLAGAWLHRAGAWSGQTLAGWTTKIVGAGLPGLIALALLMVFVIQMVPRWGSPTRATPAIGLALTVTLPLLGGAVGTASNTGVAWLGNAAATAANALFGG